MRRFYFLLFFFALSIPAFSDVWSDFHGTTTTTGIDSGSRYNAAAKFSPPLVLVWSRSDWYGYDDHNSIQESSPAIANGIVYVGSYDNNLYAWDTNTGAPVPGFPVATGSHVISSPAVSNGIVYVGSEDTKLYAWNANSGAVIAGFPVNTGDWISSSPAVWNGTVYAGSMDHNLYAWDAGNGSPIPGFPVNVGGSTSSPAIGNGIVYVASANGLLYACSTANGATISGFPINIEPDHVNTAPTVTDGVVYAGTYFGKVYAWNASNGVLIAGFPVTTGKGIVSTPAVANGIIYVGSFDKKIYAWNASDGTLISGFPTNVGAEIASSIAIANNILYFGTQDNVLYGLSAGNGEILWQNNMPDIRLPGEGFDYCSPAIAEDKLFVTSDQASGIYVFAPATQTSTPTISVTPTISPTFSITSSHSASPTITATFSITVTVTPVTPDLHLVLFPANPDPFGGQGTYFPFKVTTECEVKARIYTLSGQTVRDLPAITAVPGGNELNWDGKNSEGVEVSGGVYLYRIIAATSRGEMAEAFRKCAKLK